MPPRKQARPALDRPTQPFLIPAISTAGTNARFARCRLKIENNARLRGPIRLGRDCVDIWHLTIRSWSPERRFELRGIQVATPDRWPGFPAPRVRSPPRRSLRKRAIFPGPLLF